MIFITENVSGDFGAKSVADPVFPAGGGANLVRRAPTPDAATFHKICISEQRIGTPGGLRRVCH